MSSDLDVSRKVAPVRLLFRVAGWCAYSSAAVAAVGILLLIAFFVVGEPYGTLNDVAIVVQYLLALPILAALHQALASRAQRLRIVATAIGLIGIVAVIVLQLLLITRVVTFAQQSLPVSVALFIGVGGWILLVGYMSRTTGAVRNSVALAVAGWSYVGYPVWAYSVGRQLVSQART